VRYYSTAFSDIPFFVSDKVLYNIQRYIDNGLSGRILNLLSGILRDEVKLDVILQRINSFNG